MNHWSFGIGVTDYRKRNRIHGAFLREARLPFETNNQRGSFWNCKISYQSPPKIRRFQYLVLSILLKKLSLAWHEIILAQALYRTFW